MDRILIVEDVVELQELFLIILGEQNILLDFAASRTEALDLLSHRPNLVILDLDLDFANDGGSKICAEIKEKPDYGTMPLLLLSTDSIKLNEWTSLANIEALEKPFDLLVITKKIMSLLREAAI